MLGWDTGCGEAGAQAVKTWEVGEPACPAQEAENIQVSPATIPRCSKEGSHVSPELNTGVSWPAPWPHPQPLARETVANQTPGCGGRPGQWRLHTGVRRWSQRRLSEHMGTGVYTFPLNVNIKFSKLLLSGLRQFEASLLIEFPLIQNIRFKTEIQTKKKFLPLPNKKNCVIEKNYHLC